MLSVFVRGFSHLLPLPPTHNAQCLKSEAPRSDSQRKIEFSLSFRYCCVKESLTFHEKFSFCFAGMSKQWTRRDNEEGTMTLRGHVMSGLALLFQDPTTSN